jgi:hypothetical protein
MTKHESRDQLERWANRLDLELTEADRHSKMEAANSGEPIPRWQLQSARTPHRDTVRGFSTLAEVSQALLEEGIMSDRQHLNPQSRSADQWSPSGDGAQRLENRLGIHPAGAGQRRRTGLSL